MENAQESVTQPQNGSATIENQEVKKEQSPIDDYRNDMFKYKQQAKELQAKLDEIALKEEQDKGNYQGVIQKLKEDLKEAKSELAKDRYSFANSKLDDAIKTEALSKGITGQQLEVFMRLVDDNSKKAVEFGENFNVKQEDISNLVDDHLKRYGDVFSKKVNIVDSAPNSTPVNAPTKKFDMGKASGDDIFKYILDNKDKLK